MKIKRSILIGLFVLCILISVAISLQKPALESVNYPPEMVVRTQFWKSILDIKASPEQLGVILKVNLNSASKTRDYLDAELKRPSSECFKMTLDDCVTLRVLKILESAQKIEKSSQDFYTMKLSKVDFISLELIRALRVDNARYKPINIPTTVEEVLSVYEKLGVTRSEEKS